MECTAADPCTPNPRHFTASAAGDRWGGIRRAGIGPERWRERFAHANPCGSTARRAAFARLTRPRAVAPTTGRAGAARTDAPVARFAAVVVAHASARPRGQTRRPVTLGGARGRANFGALYTLREAGPVRLALAQEPAGAVAIAATFDARRRRQRGIAMMERCCRAIGVRCARRARRPRCAEQRERTHDHQQALRHARPCHRGWRNEAMRASIVCTASDVAYDSESV